MITPVISMLIAAGVTSFIPMATWVRAKKFACCGSFATIAPAIAAANPGPKATIAPRTCRNRNSRKIVSWSIDASCRGPDGPSRRGLYDTRRVRRWTKSTSTYSPRRSGSA